MADLRIAKVIKVHPEANAVDLIYTDTLERAPLVQCMGHQTSNSGTADLHEPTEFAEGDITPTKDRDMYAVVGRVGNGVPIVLGFLAPQVSQLAFKDRPNFRVTRHASDVYSTLDDAGNFAMAWPNGTFLKVAEDPALEDLSGLDFDAKWAIARNTDSAKTVCLVVKDDAGAQKASVTITPAGDVTMEIAGDLTQTIHGNVTATVDGDASITITGDVTSSAASWSHTGDIDVDGIVHTTGNIDSDATITAATDVVGGGKHLKTHVHSGVQAGGSNSGPPA